MKHNPDDECEAWLLKNGEAFSAADISLGVILNRLALLGLRYIFWEGKIKFQHNLIFANFKYFIINFLIVKWKLILKFIQVIK